MYDVSLKLSGVPPQSAIALQWRLATAPDAMPATIPALAFMPCAAGWTYPTLALLYRIAVLVNGFSMSAAEIANLSSHGGDFAGVDPSNGRSVPFWLAGLPTAATDTAALFNQWQRLNAIYGLKASLPTADITLFDVFAGAAASNQPAEPVSSAITSKIAAATGWAQADILTLTASGQGSSGFGYLDSDFRNEARLVKLAACLTICSNLGLTAQQLFSWANPIAPEDKSSPYRQVAQDIQNTVKAKYDDATRLQVGKPLNDKLRESCKEAPDRLHFVQHTERGLCQTPTTSMRYFLIDVEMCTCMGDIASGPGASAAGPAFRAALLAQPRERGSTFGLSRTRRSRNGTNGARTIASGRPPWRCFSIRRTGPILDLRPNKTPFFKDLETALLQGDVTAGNVEAAYLRYLESLQQVARLEIAGLYTEDDTEAGRKFTHVIGRTFTAPRVYFYRKLDNRTYVWSPWEQIDADISGDSLIPVIWNRRLFLFWPLYTEVTDPTRKPPSLLENNQPDRLDGKIFVDKHPPAAACQEVAANSTGVERIQKWGMDRQASNRHSTSARQVFRLFRKPGSQCICLYGNSRRPTPIVRLYDDARGTRSGCADRHRLRNNLHRQCHFERSRIRDAKGIQLVQRPGCNIYQRLACRHRSAAVAGWVSLAEPAKCQSRRPGAGLLSSRLPRFTQREFENALQLVSDVADLFPQHWVILENDVLDKALGGLYTALEQLRTIKPFLFYTLGSFSFDGSQGSVAIEKTQNLKSDVSSLFLSVDAVYGTSRVSGNEIFLPEYCFRKINRRPCHI